jgi:peptidyl-prolyl cis-trans isomerase SurA
MRFFCVMAAVGILAGQPGRGRAEVELADGIKAIVHDSIVSYVQVEQRTAPLRDELRRRYGSQPEVFFKKLGETLDENLEVLVENQLILHDFNSSELYHFPESAIDDQMQAYIRGTYGDNRVRFIRTLQAEGKTYEDFRREYRDHLIIQQMRYLHGASEIIISPHRIEVFYVEHKDQFKVESEVKLRMIVLNRPAGDTNETRTLAGEILAKLNEGASFAEMAAIYSQGSQRSQGGDWGWVERSVLRPELAEVAFALKPGEKSGVIETTEACYLMWVEDKRPERVQPLNDVRDRIEATLRAQEGNRLQKQWIERLKKKTFWRYF